MLVFRISRTQYAEDLDGTGAKLFGGRWNSVDVPCIYTSESRALAILEYSVNSSLNLIPRALSICTFEIDADQIQEVTIEDLPGNWKKTPTPISTQHFGSKLLNHKVPIVRVPSIIIPEEYNYLINPLTEERAFTLVDVKDFIYDIRIKTNV